jgi:poly-gamma-glutamate synthesis protein (capsule biosynthesis protein)
MIRKILAIILLASTLVGCTTGTISYESQAQIATSNTDIFNLNYSEEYNNFSNNILLSYDEGTSDLAKPAETFEAVTSSVDPSKTVNLTFVGDCTLAYNMVDSLGSKEPSYFFKNCEDIFSNSDYVVANCEGVLSDSNSKPRAKTGSRVFHFRSAATNANVFSAAGIDAVSISNNHTKDYGDIGLSDTKEALEDANITWGDDDNVIVTEINGVKVGILCVNFWSEWYVSIISEKITTLSESTDIQIVYFHGGTENVHTPPKFIEEGAHAFVDSGADLVIGAHPHVLQPYEVYEGTPIMYSLGNFCYGGHRRPENRTAVFQIEFVFDSENRITSFDETIHPFYVYTGDTNNFQPTPMEKDDPNYTKVIDFVYGKTDSPV